MLLFVAVMLPAVISVCIFEGATGTDLKPKKFFCLYALSVICVNLICAAFKTFVLNTGEAVMSAGGDITPSAFFNYSVMAVPAAVAVGLVAALLKRKNVRVSGE